MSPTKIRPPGVHIRLAMRLEVESRGPSAVRMYDPRRAISLTLECHDPSAAPNAARAMQQLLEPLVEAVLSGREYSSWAQLCDECGCAALSRLPAWLEVAPVATTATPATAASASVAAAAEPVAAPVTVVARPIAAPVSTGRATAG